MTTEKEQVVEGEQLDAEVLGQTAPPEKTVEEQLAEAKETGRLEAEEKYKGFQRKVSKTEREIAELKELQTQPQSQDNNQLFTAMMEVLKAPTSESGEVNPNIAKVEQAIAATKQRDEYNRKLQVQNAATLKVKSGYEQKIIEAGLDPTDDRFDDVWEIFDLTDMNDGKWGRVEKKLEKVLKVTEKKEVSGEPKETMEAFEKRIREDEGKKVKEKLGLLETDASTPQSGSLNDKDFIQRFSEGKIDITKESIERIRKINA